MKRFQRAILLSGAVLLSACGARAGDATPTVSVELVQTQAVATFAAAQTETAVAMPTSTPTETPTPLPTETSTPSATATSGIPTIGVVPTSSCYGLAFVTDVTIPDNTSMTPGQKFTKTWRVKNNGSCAWDAGFKFNFTGGEAMGGSSITLQSAVNVGAETELSVAMTAPATNGTYRSNWRMTTAAGAYFGDEVYVIIVVGGNTPTATATKATNPSPTPTVTVTETPSS